MKKLLLHTCCAPCAGYVYEILSTEYDVTLFFYNPNIFPEQEYVKRKNELLKYSNSKNLKICIYEEEDGYVEWQNKINGLEQEPECGKRCYKCFQIRLERSAIFGKENKFEVFATTMSVSPHKNHTSLNEIGMKLSKKYNVEFLESNFKKNNGFKKSCEISRINNFYRQNYCGCEYSIKKV